MMRPGLAEAELSTVNTSIGDAMQIKIKYFAQLRSASKVSDESLEITDQDSARSIYYRLAEKYDFTLKFEQLRVAINDKFVDGDCRLAQGDCLVFIPPVSGG
jgi:molybdopterin converting factor subunit 1